MQPDQIKPMSTAEEEPGTHTKFGNAPGKQKENSAHREFTPAEEWDRVAHTLIIQELAPKGFKDMKGLWKGKVAANIPFLPKQSVIRCQNIAAQLVRVYREEARATLTERHENEKKALEEWREYLKNAAWWRFKERRFTRNTIAFFEGRVHSSEVMLDQLDQVKIPTK